VLSQPTGFKVKLAKPTGAQAQATNSYVTHITISVHSKGGAFYVVTLNQGPPTGLTNINKPTFDDHLSTALIGKTAKNIVADAEFINKLEGEGFLYPFHNASRRFPNKTNVTVKKAVNTMRMNQAEINVKAFVFVLQSEEEKSVEDWCKILTDVITPALQKQDTARMRAGILKNKPEYSPYIANNNISVRLSENEYSPLDNSITDIDVSKYVEWFAKCCDGLVELDNSPIDTIEESPWQLTIYERHADLREGFYTNWEESGFNTFPIVKYGFPFCEGTPKYTVTKRIDVLIGAFNSLTPDDDNQHSSVTYAHALVSSFSTLLRTSLPGSMGMIDYVRIREWRAGVVNKPYVSDVVEELGSFDSEFAKYRVAFGDAPLKMEVNDTVPTLPIVEGHSEPTTVTNAASAPTGTEKRVIEQTLNDGDAENGKKKAKKNISRKVTLPQA
jgi:hypothetical protein